MAKITVRIPTEQFAFIEVAYDTLEEYEKGYPEFVRVFTKVRKQIKESGKKTDDIPFESKNPNRK